MWMLWLLTSSLGPLVGLPCHGEFQKCTIAPPTSKDIGLCRDGVQSCIADKWGPCLCGQGPTTEICDCKDNDCDGLIDENCSCGCPGTKRTCGFSPVGQCQQGVQICVGAGVWGNCIGTIGPNNERCDGKDNDCDGKIDEDLNCGPCTDGESRTCFDHGTAAIGEGPCKAGTETCTGGKWGPCLGQILPETEICDNIDNDCNGYVDGVERLCGSDKGTCQQGIQTCELGVWSVCRGERTPTVEICDCKDNDCDGTVDEDVICPTPGDICYYGRCVPNCFQGKCIQPDERSLPEPPQEATQEPSSRDEDTASFDATESSLVVPSSDSVYGLDASLTQDPTIDTPAVETPGPPEQSEKATSREDTGLFEPSGEAQISVTGCGCQTTGSGDIGWMSLGVLLLCLSWDRRIPRT